MIAFNFNGEGLASSSALHYTCVKPIDLAAPLLVSTTSESMTVEWNEPSDNGGCPITGYQLFRDNGLSGLPTIEVTTTL